MHIRVSSVTFAAVLGTIVTLPGSVGEATLSAAFVPPSSDAVVRQMSAMPLSFTKNEGQWDERVLFRTSAGGATIWLTRDGITYQFIRRVSREDANLSRRDGFPVPPGKREGRKLSETEPESIEQAVVHARFVNPNPGIAIEADGLLDYKCNYFLGDDPTQWRTDVPNCTAVVYRDAYPGVDLRLQGAGGLLTTAWTARAGADLSQVRFHYDGNATVTETDSGELFIEAPWGLLLQSSPTAHEEVSTAGAGSTVRAAPAQTGASSVTIVYSTYLGGGSYDFGYGIAVDVNGSAYVTGVTWSTNFPTLNAFQSAHAGGTSDAFVTKLNSGGDGLEYSTYLGGGSEDYGYGIAVDANGSAYVTGWTESTDFPTAGPYQTDKGGYDDAYVTKLSATGNALVYSTYLGGGNNDYGFGIAVDANESAYVTGYTYSTNFPTAGPYQTFQGGRDAFVTKLSATGNALVYSTYLGGGDHDYGLGIAVDADGSAYVTGQTRSGNFPTAGPYQTDQGGDDAFVTKLSAAGSALVYSTYLGGGDNDYGLGIAVDLNGSAYVTGGTWSTDFPTAGPYQTDQGSLDAFVTKLSAAGNALVYSTYLGGSSLDVGSGIAVDTNGSAYVTGLTASADFPTAGPYQTDQGGDDAFVTKLSAAGNALVYSTYLGGGDYDYGDGIAVDANGSAYVTGRTVSTDFPTAGPYQTDQSGADAFVTKLGFSGGCGDLSFRPDTDLFCDDFNDGDDDGWSHPSSNCAWSVVNGEYTTSLAGHRVWCISTAGDPGWTNYAVEADVRGIAGVDKVLLFRFQDENNFYAVNLRSDWGGLDEITINKMQDGDFNADIVSAQYPSQNGNWYHLKVTAVGDSFTVSVDGNLVTGWRDRSPAVLYTGKIAVAGWTGDTDVDTLAYDNVVVNSLTLPPAEPELIAVLDAGTGHDLVVKWTQADRSGVTNYRVYFGLNPGEYIFGSIPIVEDGQNEYIYRLNGLPEHTPCYVAVRAYNAITGQWSDYATTNPDSANYATIPIVMVHGWGHGSPESWTQMKVWLRNDHFNYLWAAEIDPCGVPGEELFDLNSEQLSSYVEQRRSELQSTTGIPVIPVTRVAVLAHSMGGLVSRRYAAGDDPWSAHAQGIEVERLIMLGTPNGGVPLADVLMLQKKRCGLFEPRCLTIDALSSVICNGPANREFALDKILEFNHDPGINRYASDIRYVAIAGIQSAGNNHCDWLGCPNDGFISEASVRYTIPRGPLSVGCTHVAVDFEPYCIPGLVSKCVMLHTELPTRRAIYDDYVLPELSGEGIDEPCDMTVSGTSGSANPMAAAYSFAGIGVCRASSTTAETLLVWTGDTLSVLVDAFGGNLVIELITPTGTVYDSTCVDSGTVGSCSISEGIHVFDIPNPESGIWILRVSDAGISDTAWPYFYVAELVDGVELTSTVSTVQPIEGDSLSILATLTLGGAPLIAASVNAQGYTDSGVMVIDEILFDDGNGVDVAADDGIYSVTWIPDSGYGSTSLVIIASGNPGPFTKESVHTLTVQERCACGCHADPVGCNGIVDVFDVVKAVDVAFRSGAPVVDPSSTCPKENTDVTCDDVTNVFDVVKFVDVAFRSANPVTTFCDPCG